MKDGEDSNKKSNPLMNILHLGYNTQNNNKPNNAKPKIGDFGN